MALNIEIDREVDGRWIAEIPDIPGVMVYGMSRQDAISKVMALALRVIAERIEYGEPVVDLGSIFPVFEKQEKTADQS
jgi:predicted RNase H-like HicB family nuclease